VDPSGHSIFGSVGDFFEGVGREVGRFVKNYGADIVAGAVGAAITVLTWGLGAPAAFALGGMAAGATNAGLNGAPLSGILQAAAIGGVAGAIGGGLYAANVPWWALAGGGAAVATATGGVEGLAHYAAGFAGAMLGGSATLAFKDAATPQFRLLAAEGDKYPLVEKSWAEKWWNSFTGHLQFSFSSTLLGRGETTSGGISQKVTSPLTLVGGSFDLYIGDIPGPYTGYGETTIGWAGTSALGTSLVVVRLMAFGNMVV